MGGSGGGAVGVSHRQWAGLCFVVFFFSLWWWRGNELQSLSGLPESRRGYAASVGL